MTVIVGAMDGGTLRSVWPVTRVETPLRKGFRP
jgi:hypothetical protein